MRRLLASLGVVAALLGGLVVGGDQSGAAIDPEPGMMQAVPATSVEPATVVVSNVDDTASRCEVPNGLPVGLPSGATSTQVSLNLSSTNGTNQMNTVMPNASGDWTQTYNNLPAGTYTVTGSCEADVSNGTQEATPQQVPPFVYDPVQFVVTAPAVPAPAAPAGQAPAPIVGSPTFTG
jgi:hypothetical protein